MTTLLLGGSSLAASAEPPTDEELASTCDRAVARIGTQLVKSRLKASRVCLKAWRRCETHDGERCRARAAHTCDRAAAQRERDRARGTRAVEKRCGALPADLLLEVSGLGYRMLADVCLEHYGTAATSPSGIAQCVAAHHECYAAAMHAAMQPADGSSLDAVAPALATVDCPERFDTEEARGIEAPIDDRCAQRLERLLTSALLTRLKELQRCGNRLLRCALANLPEADCETRVLTSCRARLGRLAARLGKKRATLIDRCDATDARNANDCSGGETSVAGATTCLSRSADCWAEELLQFEAPRGHGLLDSGAREALGSACVLEDLPTDLPTPPVEVELPLEGAGTPAPTPAATPVAPAPTVPDADPTQAAAATATTTPEPMVTATPRPTPTSSPCLGYALAVDPTDPDVLYASVRGRGFFRNTTGGQTPWIPLGLENVVVNEIAINHEDSRILYVGTEGQGVFRSDSSGTRFTVTGLGGVRNASRVRALALDAADPETVYAGTAGAGVVRSINGGSGWQVTSLFSFPGGAFVRALGASPRDSNVLVAGVANGGAYTSNAQGDRWSFTSLNTLPGGNSVLSLANDPTDSDIVYAGTVSGDVFQSPDGGNAWFQTNFGAFGTGQARALTVNPNDAAVLYASRDDDIDRSPDGGRSWRATGFGPRARGSTVCDIIVTPGRQSAVFANTNDGRVFTSTDRGTTWREISNGL